MQSSKTNKSTNKQKPSSLKTLNISNYQIKKDGRRKKNSISKFTQTQTQTQTHT